MPKNILALLFTMLAIAGCNKSSTDQPPPPEIIPSIEGLFTGHVTQIGNGDTLEKEILLQVLPGNKLGISSIQDILLHEKGDWQLQGTTFAGTFGNWGWDSLTIAATWNTRARTLIGNLVDSAQAVWGTVKLTQKDPLPIEGTYLGNWTSYYIDSTHSYALNIKPGGVIEDDFGAVGTWKRKDDMITANFPAIGTQQPYTIVAFYNPVTGMLWGDWERERVEAWIKVYKRPI